MCFIHVFRSPFLNTVFGVSPRSLLTSLVKLLKEHLAETYLEPSRTSTMEPFCENSYGF